MSDRSAETTERPAAEERRASGTTRVPFEALVAVAEPSGAGFEAETVDVSADGMRLRTAYLPEIGKKLTCRFDLGGKELVVQGEVLWCTEEPKGGEFGVRFLVDDAETADAVSAMCKALVGEVEAESAVPSSVVPAGARVRLHIEGLGSPMKARVRESAKRELAVGSNLEFLRVGRALELEDVEHGKKRDAHIANVRVDVDPSTHVPQLVVMLAYGKCEAPAEPVAVAAAPKSPAAAPPVKTAKPEARAAAAKDPEAAPATVNAAGVAVGLGSRVATMSRMFATKVAPTLSGAGGRAKDAMTGVLELIKRRRGAEMDGKKPQAARRMTAPPPGGAITTDGRKLVREEEMHDEEHTPLPRGNRRAAIIGGAVGLVAVLAVFGASRAGGSHGQATSADASASASPSGSAEVVASVPPRAAGSGAAMINVPLFGPTPASTLEPVAPPALASAAAPGLGDPGSADRPTGPILKEWGSGEIHRPIVLRIKTDGPIARLTGAAGAAGFTISLPDRRSVSSEADLLRKDKRLASVKLMNGSRGAEITLQFKEGVPPYMAKIKGDKLEIAIGREPHGGKVAKKHKKH